MTVHNFGIGQPAAVVRCVCIGGWAQCRAITAQGIPEPGFSSAGLDFRRYPGRRVEDLEAEGERLGTFLNTQVVLEYEAH
jgi:hypothetical protein